MVTEVVESWDVKLIFQMVIGGGAYRAASNRRITSIAHRDITHGLVFDIFYLPGYEDLAEQYQTRMGNLLEAYGASGDDEVRMQWGSFGNTNMSDEAVWRKYFDDERQYNRARRLKKMVDPDDIFHTEFTVPLPDRFRARSGPGGDDGGPDSPSRKRSRTG